MNCPINYKVSIFGFNLIEGKIYKPLAAMHEDFLDSGGLLLKKEGNKTTWLTKKGIVKKTQVDWYLFYEMG
jgi:hypothetical protein